LFPGRLGISAENVGGERRGVVAKAEVAKAEASLEKLKSDLAAKQVAAAVSFPVVPSTQTA
jgi:hypothetical protein